MEMAGSLLAEGQLQPVLVQSTAASQIADGERRFLGANNHHLRGEP